MHDYLIVEAISNGAQIDELEAILQRSENQFSDRIFDAVYFFGMTGDRSYLNNLLPQEFHNDDHENAHIALRIDLKHLFCGFLFVLNPVMLSNK